MAAGGGRIGIAETTMGTMFTEVSMNCNGVIRKLLIPVLKEAVKSPQKELKPVLSESILETVKAPVHEINTNPSVEQGMTSKTVLARESSLCASIQQNAVSSDENPVNISKTMRVQPKKRGRKPKLLKNNSSRLIEKPQQKRPSCESAGQRLALPNCEKSTEVVFSEHTLDNIKQEDENFLKIENITCINKEGQTVKPETLKPCKETCNTVSKTDQQHKSKKTPVYQKKSLLRIQPKDVFSKAVIPQCGHSKKPLICTFPDPQQSYQQRLQLGNAVSSASMSLVKQNDTLASNRSAQLKSVLQSFAGSSVIAQPMPAFVNEIQTQTDDSVGKCSGGFSGNIGVISCSSKQPGSSGNTVIHSVPSNIEKAGQSSTVNTVGWKAPASKTTANTFLAIKTTSGIEIVPVSTCPNLVVSKSNTRGKDIVSIVSSAQHHNKNSVTSSNQMPSQVLNCQSGTASAITRINGTLTHVVTNQTRTSNNVPMHQNGVMNSVFTNQIGTMNNGLANQNGALTNSLINQNGILNDTVTGQNGALNNVMTAHSGILNTVRTSQNGIITEQTGLPLTNQVNAQGNILTNQIVAASNILTNQTGAPGLTNQVGGLGNILTNQTETPSNISTYQTAPCNLLTNQMGVSGNIVNNQIGAPGSMLSNQTGAPGNIVINQVGAVSNILTNQAGPPGNILTNQMAPCNILSNQMETPGNILTNQMGAVGNILTNQMETAGNIFSSQMGTPGHILTNQMTAQGSTLTNQMGTPGHILTNQMTAQGSTLTNQMGTTGNILTNQMGTPGNILTNQMRTPGNILTNQMGTLGSIQTNQIESMSSMATNHQVASAVTNPIPDFSNLLPNQIDVSGGSLTNQPVILGIVQPHTKQGLVLRTAPGQTNQTVQPGSVIIQTNQTTPLGPVLSNGGVVMGNVQPNLSVLSHTPPAAVSQSTTGILRSQPFPPLSQSLQPRNLSQIIGQNPEATQLVGSQTAMVESVTVQNEGQKGLEKIPALVGHLHEKQSTGKDTQSLTDIIKDTNRSDKQSQEHSSLGTQVLPKEPVRKCNQNISSKSGTDWVFRKAIIKAAMKKKNRLLKGHLQRNNKLSVNSLKDNTVTYPTQSSVAQLSDGSLGSEGPRVPETMSLVSKEASGALQIMEVRKDPSNSWYVRKSMADQPTLHKKPQKVTVLQISQVDMKEPQKVALLQPNQAVREEPQRVALLQPNQAVREEPQRVALLQPNQAVREEPQRVALLQPNQAVREEPQRVALLQPNQAVREEPQRVALLQPNQAVREEPQKVALLQPNQAMREEPQRVTLLQPSQAVRDEPQGVSLLQPSQAVLPDGQVAEVVTELIVNGKNQLLTRSASGILFCISKDSVEILPRKPDRAVKPDGKLPIARLPYHGVIKQKYRKTRTTNKNKVALVKLNTVSVKRKGQTKGDTPTFAKYKQKYNLKWCSVRLKRLDVTAVGPAAYRLPNLPRQKVNMKKVKGDEQAAAVCDVSLQRTLKNSDKKSSPVSVESLSYDWMTDSSSDTIIMDYSDNEQEVVCD